MNSIVIKGACVNNLKNIDIEIPKHKLTVITGVSGSGKSSLAFDIIFEEGRRQYLQSLGVLTELNSKIKFQSISGLGPTIAVQQNIIRQSNPRSTVATKTSLLKMFSVLYSIMGKSSCSVCSGELESNICKNCGNKQENLPATYFNYSTTDGMCIKCSGKGSYYEIDFNKLVPKEDTTLLDVINTTNPSPGFRKLLLKKFSCYLHKCFNDIPNEVKVDIIYGQYTSSNSQNRSYCLKRIFEMRYLKDGDNSNGLYNKVVCSECEGLRVGEEARNVFINSKHIGELCKMTISELKDYFLELMPLTNSIVAKNLVNDISYKLKSLCDSKLSHLSLLREVSSLSGGEMQRLFLNYHLSSNLDSLIYVLDEPTSGLHETEKKDLLKAIRRLVDIGNTVIVVEHDVNMISMADHVIDIGPEAGVKGGEVVYQGNYNNMLKNKKSVTGKYISKDILMPKRVINDTSSNKFISINKATKNNLKNISLKIPLNALVGIAGISGSGKSSLISEVIYKKNKVYSSNLKEIEDLYKITDVVEVSQKPIGRNHNSNIISYIGIWDKVRKLYADESKLLGQNLTAGHFSFNSKGACKDCSGSGYEKVWLGGNQFLSNICKTCGGNRYNDVALSVKLKNKTIVEVLNMSVQDACSFFAENKNVINTLQILNEIGMGYIKLGQPTPTLSGGEAQRIKLAKELGKQRKCSSLYVLDEPTTGLSLYDTSRLLTLLNKLVQQGNSVIVIEHDINILSQCDYLIELGPDSGVNGGNVIAKGTPNKLINNPNSETGKYLSCLN